QIGVRKCRRRSGLAAEALCRSWVRNQLLPDDLHRHFALQSSVEATIDSAHTTSSQALLKLVAAGKQASKVTEREFGAIARAPQSTGVEHRAALRTLRNAVRDELGRGTLNQNCQRRGHRLQELFVLGGIRLF